jgi:arginyl-tRNA synthetase
MMAWRIISQLKLQRRKISVLPERKPLDIRSLLQDRIFTAISSSYGQHIASSIKIHVTAISNEEYGHYQCICAMPLAKQLKMKPIDVATQILQHLETKDLISSSEVAGSGFMNLR